MNAEFSWKLFLETGSPVFYLIYKLQERAEARGRKTA